MWISCLLAFIGSACTLVIELIAGRIMAPYIGVSLYTWTSVIGVVLAGMSVGNFTGGVLADRFASRRALALIFMAGGVSCLSILILTHAIEGVTFGLSFLPRIVFSIAIIFFLPSFVLGMVSPMVVKLALANLEHSGHTVGTIYASSTVGSIVGTFTTGFWLISQLGTRRIVWLVAGILLLTGLLIAVRDRSRRTAAVVVSSALAIAFFGAIGAGWVSGKYRAPCDVESNYYCIRVFEAGNDGHSARVLMLDRLIHSYVVPDDPRALDYGYEHAYSDLTEAHAIGRDRIDTLFLGGGGYTFPRYVEAVYPASTIDVVEIDPAVTATAYERLGLPRTSRIRSFNQDARMFLTEWIRSQAVRFHLWRRIQRPVDPVSPDDRRVQPDHCEPFEAGRRLPDEHHRQVRGRGVSQGGSEHLARGFPLRLRLRTRRRVPAVRSEHVRHHGEPAAVES